MLFLRVTINEFYGENHPEGIVRKYENIALEKEMTVRDLEILIKTKMVQGMYSVKNFSVEILE